MAIKIESKPSAGQLFEAGFVKGLSKQKGFGQLIMEKSEIAQELQHKPELVATSDTEALVNELCALEKKLREWDVAAVNKRMKEIKDELQSIASNSAPFEPVAFSSHLGSVMLSAAAKMTVVKSIKALLGYLTEKFDDAAVESVLTVNLTALKKLLSENEIAQFTETVAGSRKTTISPK